MTDEPKPQDDSPDDFLIYDAPDGNTRIEVRMQNETVWLTQKQMAELFQTSVPNINQHLATIFADGELASEATIKKYLIVQTEGKREVSRQIDHYNLDDFLRLSDREILNHAGKVSHDDAKAKAQRELEAYRQQQGALPESVDQHFDQALVELKRIEDEAKRRKEDS